jgi:hypothetical protein
MGLSDSPDGQDAEGDLATSRVVFHYSGAAPRESILWDDLDVLPQPFTPADQERIQLLPEYPDLPADEQI